VKFSIRSIFLLLLLFTFGHANEYRYSENLELSKDEHKIFLVKYAKNEKLFKFRWTLYANGGLVVLRSYDRIVAQNTLFLRAKKRSIKVDLMPKGAGYGNVPHILIKFIEYDYAKNKAIFKLLLADKNLEVNLEHFEDR